MSMRASRFRPRFIAQNGAEPVGRKPIALRLQKSETACDGAAPHASAVNDRSE
jgi:hypothetical protein